MILKLARELLQSDGELGWNRPRRASFLAATTSPALKAVTPGLPPKNKWGASTVVMALLAHFEIAGGESTLCLALRTQPT